MLEAPIVDSRETWDGSERFIDKTPLRHVANGSPQPVGSYGTRIMGFLIGSKMTVFDDNGSYDPRMKSLLELRYVRREAIRLRHGVGISGPCTISTKKYAPHLNTTLHLNVDLQIKVR